MRASAILDSDEGKSVHARELLRSTQRIGTGLAFVMFPVVFVVAFSVHPNLLHPLNTALLVVVALHFMKRLERSAGAWAGFLGAALAVLGALALAADKGALCLTMSALDGLSDTEFTSMMPGLLAMFSKRGWLVLLWGIVLLPVGFGLQAIALLKTESLTRWQSWLFLVGVLLIATPDGVEIVNLTASVLLTVAFVPYGLRMIRNEARGLIAREARG
jgi:hypothetical protein